MGIMAPIFTYSGLFQLGNLIYLLNVYNLVFLLNEYMHTKENGLMLCIAYILTVFRANQPNLDNTEGDEFSLAFLNDFYNEKVTSHDITETNHL